MNKNVKQLMTITNIAANKILLLIDERKDKTLGVRISIKTKGCSGLAYSMEYADKKRPFDEEINDKGIKLFIDPKAIMFVLGTQMDYKEESFSSGFFFKNPNEKGRCGCGESFHV